MKDTRAIDLGDRFRDDDSRSPGRYVNVVEHLGGDYYRVQVDEHPTNSSAIGRVYPISGKTLRQRFTRVSR